jgi:hypothetical protein
MTILLLGIILCGDPPKVDAPQDRSVPVGQEDQKGKKRLAAARMLIPDLTLMAVLSILFLLLGGLMFVRRFGARLRQTPNRKRTKYYDMTVFPDTDEPPHEPSAEERQRDKN